MFLKESIMNGEKVFLFCKRVSASSNLFEISLHSEIPARALEKLCNIMKWDKMPKERVMQQLQEGFLANHLEVSEIFTLS